MSKQRAGTTVLRGLMFLFAVDLLLLLVRGEYTIPLLEIRSAHPCTSVFVILVLELARRLLLARSPRDTLRDSGVFVLLLVWAAFFANFRWRGAGDVVGASLTPFSILQDGDLYLDEYADTFLAPEYTGRYERNGHTLTKYSSAPGILLVPFYLVPALVGTIPTDLFVHQLQKIGSAFMVALSAWLLLLTLRRYVRADWALTLTLGYALGTWSMSTSSQAIWQHGPGQLFLALALFLVARGPERSPASPPRALIDPRAAALGFALAMAVWIRYPNAVVFAVLALFVASREPRRIPAFVIGSVIPLAALAADNVLHTGSPWTTGYQAEAARFDTPMLTGLTGLLFSPGRSIFLFSPFLLFSFIGFGIAWTRRGDVLLRFLSVAVAGVIIVHSKWHAWHGGWCFGARFLADVMPLVVFAIVPAVAWLERSFWARQVFLLALLLSVILHVLGASVTWWWEKEISDVWSWDRHPVVYLLRQAGASADSGRVATHWAVVAILTCVGLWFAARIFRARSRFATERVS